MATQDAIQSITLVAGADLSTKQFTFVTVNASGLAVNAGDGAMAYGVLLNNPISGQAAEVNRGHIVKVKCGGVVTRGGNVGCDAAGLAVNAATADVILGVALETGATNAVISMIYNPR